jgi:hypothetical protein
MVRQLVLITAITLCLAVSLTAQEAKKSHAGKVEVIVTRGEGLCMA